MDNILLNNLDKLHTTFMGEKRIRKNLSLTDTDEVVGWCKEKICLKDTVITKTGKNWYAETTDAVITVNASSYTIITAHSKKLLFGK